MPQTTQILSMQPSSGGRDVAFCSVVRRRTVNVSIHFENLKFEMSAEVQAHG